MNKKIQSPGVGMLSRIRMTSIGLALSCCFFLWIIFSLPYYASKIPVHIDEIAWFIDTDAFEQLFIKKDISSSFWQSVQRYDQPPLVKYIYGGYLWAKDSDVFEIRERLEKEWGRWGIYSNPNTTEIGFKIFGPYIYQMRQINHVAIIGALMAFYMLLILVSNTSVMVAIIGTMMLFRNELFLQEMTHATHDGFMLSFMLFAVLFYSLYIQNKKKHWIVLAIVCAAFSVASKLTGVMATIAILMHQVIGIFKEWQHNKLALVHFFAVTLIIFMLWVLVNPSLYKDSINRSIQYYSFRMDQSNRLQAAYPSASLVKFSAKVRASWCTLVAPDCLGYFEKGTLTTWYWINILLIVLGLFHLVQILLYNTKKENVIILGIFLFLITVWNVVLLPMHYGRYYLPTQIGIFFISTCGIEVLRLGGYRILKNKTPAKWRGFFDKTS